MLLPGGQTHLQTCSMCMHRSYGVFSSRAGWHSGADTASLQLAPAKLMTPPFTPSCIYSSHRRRSRPGSPEADVYISADQKPTASTLAGVTTRCDWHPGIPTYD